MTLRHAHSEQPNPGRAQSDDEATGSRACCGAALQHAHSEQPNPGGTALQHTHSEWHNPGGTALQHAYSPQHNWRDAALQHTRGRRRCVEVWSPGRRRKCLTAFRKHTTWALAWPGPERGTRLGCVESLGR